MTYDISPRLKQRGRAGVDFMAHIFRGSEGVREQAKADIETAAGSIDQLPNDLDARTEFMLSNLEDSRAFRVKSLIGEWHAINHGIIATEAFEEIQGELEPIFDKVKEGPARLTLNPDFDAPDYWDGVNFHRTDGGWDGHDYSGYVHGEIVHRKMVDALFPGGIFAQRLKVAKSAPKDSYETILDMGCSTGHFTLGLQQAYPDAKITGVDLSPRVLEQAQRVANAHDYDWDLYQANAEETGFDEGSFDLVGSYIMLHEMPERAIRASFAEAFRVLRPGGDMVMSDVTRYADMDKLAEWNADFGAQTGGEPHWRGSASLDLGSIAREVGFVDVHAAGEPPFNYPYVVRGTKPAV